MSRPHSDSASSMPVVNTHPRAVRVFSDLAQDNRTQKAGKRRGAGLQRIDADGKDICYAPTHLCLEPDLYYGHPYSLKKAMSEGRRASDIMRIGARASLRTRLRSNCNGTLCAKQNSRRKVTRVRGASMWSRFGFGDPVLKDSTLLLPIESCRGDTCPRFLADAQTPTYRPFFVLGCILRHRDLTPANGILHSRATVQNLSHVLPHMRLCIADDTKLRSDED